MREHETQFTEDDVYALMMDALDGALSSYGYQQLEDGLQQFPTLQQEWVAMQAVDSLLMGTPMVMPAPSVNFTARTLARLPNLRFRRWLSGAVYAVLLLSGILPFIMIALLSGSFSDVAQLAAVILDAFGQLLLSLGNQAGQQPAIIGTILVMIGSITLWSGVYQRLVAEPQAA
ncbi:MAG: hypothetical protein KDE51_07950 [Anaerolineales bacterium]|nr:hypothetical protein [Anaerolineales bacterium]